MTMREKKNIWVTVDKKYEKKIIKGGGGGRLGCTLDNITMKEPQLEVFMERGTGIL